MKLSRINACLLMIILFCHVFSTSKADEVNTSNVSTYQCGNFVYVILDNGDAEIVDYCAYPRGNITIPNDLDGHPVTSIRENPFYGDDYTISVNKNHPYLATINGVLFGKTDKRIICCPKTLKLEEYTIPEGICIIGSYAFYDCRALKKITIPNSVVKIEDYAFYSCDGLSRVEIPNSVSSIGAMAFQGDSRCHVQFVLATNHPFFQLIDGILYNKANKSVVCCTDDDNRRQYSIQAGTEIIGDGAFYFRISNYPRYYVQIPDSVTEIGDMAFFRNFLHDLVIPDGVTSIGSMAFYDCKLEVSGIFIPESVTSIGAKAFYTYISYNEDRPRGDLIVVKGSYAEQYCIENGHKYTYYDPATEDADTDWLNN